MSKPKSITELQDEKQQLITRSKGIVEKAKKENRSLSEEENAELGKNQIRHAEIDIEINQRQLENRSAGAPHAKATEKFMLCRCIANMVNGRAQNESDAAILNHAAEQHRMSVSQMPDARGIVIPMSLDQRAAFTAGTESQTRVLIDEEQQEMLLPLQANLVLARAGARFMTGLQGDIYWPSFSGVNVFWESENGAAKDGAGAFTKGTTYKPLRLTAYVDISKQLLVQENASVEAYIRQAIAQAIAQKLEATAFGTKKSQANTPDGMFDATSLHATIKGEMTWDKLVSMETEADIKNALTGNLAYIMHPALIGKAKTKVKDASGAGGFIFAGNGDGMINGYNALRTTNLPTKLATGTDEYGIVFGDWSQFFVGQWGGIELLVDPYTQAVNGTVRLIVNCYFNMGFIRKDSFTIASMK